LIGLVREVIRRFAEDEGLLLASALSFGVVLCLAPFTLILFSAAGFLLESREISDYVSDSATIILPAYGRQLAEFLVVLTKERAVTGIVGAVSLAVFASQLFSLTRRVLNRAFRVREPRGLVHTFALDVLSVLLVGGVVIVMALVTMVLVAVRALAQSVLPLPPMSGLSRGLSVVVIYALATTTLILVYRTFPSTPVAGRAAAIAAVTVMALWEMARLAFATYMHTSGVYGRLYGSFGIWIAGLVWIYYSSSIFVLGAELAAVLNRSTPSGAPSGLPRPPDTRDAFPRAR